MEECSITLLDSTRERYLESFLYFSLVVEEFGVGGGILGSQWVGSIAVRLLHEGSRLGIPCMYRLALIFNGLYCRHMLCRSFMYVCLSGL